MKYNVGDIVVVKKEGYQIYAYILRIEHDNVGMNWYTLKYQVPQRFGGTIVEYARYNEKQMPLYVDKVP